MAAAGIIFNVLWTYYLFYLVPDGAIDSESYNIGVISLCLCILLFVAQQKKNPRLYMPFIVFYVSFWIPFIRIFFLK